MSGPRGWAAHEIIGVSVVNSRGVNKMVPVSEILLRRPVYWTATVTAILEARKAGTGRADVVFEIRDPGDTGREGRHRWNLGTCTRTEFESSPGQDAMVELAGLEAYSYWWDFLDDVRDAVEASDVMSA